MVWRRELPQLVAIIRSHFLGWGSSQLYSTYHFSSLAGRYMRLGELLVMVAIVSLDLGGYWRALWGTAVTSSRGRRMAGEH